MTLPFSKPPLCRTGHSRGDRYSPAWEQADTVVALYRAKDGHKTIAKQLGISPRIAREILIERGEWMPGSLKSLSGGPCSRAAAQASKLQGVVKRMRSRVKKCINKKPPRIKSATAGMNKAETFRWRYHNDPSFLAFQLIRRRMRKIMSGGVSYRQAELMGCNAHQFRAHIESQFVSGMGWHNNGTGKGKWHLDHISPCKGFDPLNIGHMRTLWHWTNCRPIWSKTNMKKSAKINHRNAQLNLHL